MQRRGTTLLIVGGTAAGVAAAVRAAREGVETVLVSHGDHLGGVLASLGAVETHYPGARSPIVEAFKEKVVEHYRTTYGEGSEPYRVCISLDPNNPMITFEPHVAEQILTEMVEAEACLTVLRGYDPVSVELSGDELRAVTLQASSGGEVLRVEAHTFIDASYEGDLAAVAGVQYRVGRESRREYDEPHAGKLFTRWIQGEYPTDAVLGKLNLIPKWTTLGLLPGSTGEDDDNIQDYSYRLCVSNDPDNRRLPEKPEGYDRAAYLGIVEPPEVAATKRYALHHRFLTNTLEDTVAQDHLFHGHALPNNKRSWNATNFTGAGKAYPDADWEERREIEKRHLGHALGIMYFLQNDEKVPEAIRPQARAWGLARDEFADNDNVPHNLYVREARRIRGRYTFRESDCLLAPGLERAPIHEDAVAITEFPLDSLPCTTERRPGTLPDGQFFLMEASRPGGVPYRVMLPERLRNLLIPVAASVTHVAWGTVRQTPALIQLGEAAGCAAVLARQRGTSVASLDTAALQQKLVEGGHMVAFFNDFDMATREPWVSAVQYLGTKGFFASYDARPLEPLTHATAQVWARAAKDLAAGMLDAMARARELASLEDQRKAVTAEALTQLLTQALEGAGIGEKAVRRAVPLSTSSETISRGDACSAIYTLLKEIADEHS